LLWGNLATPYDSIFECPFNYWPLVATSVVLTVSLPIGLPSDSKRSSVRFISYRNDRYWEKNLSQVLYIQRRPHRFLNRVIPRLKLPMNFLHRNLCAQNHFSHTESLHDANLTRCDASCPYRPLEVVRIHSHEIVINGQPSSRNCTDKTVPVLGTLQYCVLSCVVLCKSKRLLYCFRLKKTSLYSIAEDLM
jgi:hypothetical protein